MIAPGRWGAGGARRGRRLPPTSSGGGGDRYKRRLVSVVSHAAPHRPTGDQSQWTCVALVASDIPLGLCSFGCRCCGTRLRIFARWRETLRRGGRGRRLIVGSARLGARSAGVAGLFGQVAGASFEIYARPNPLLSSAMLLSEPMNLVRLRRRRRLPSRVTHLFMQAQSRA